jgi:CRP/FNR family transcriptional regulator
MSFIDELAERMKSLPHFSRLSISDLISLVKAGEIKRVDEGQCLFEEGMPCNGLYVVLSGEVKLQKIGPEGQNYIMAVIEPISMVNEVAVLDKGPNPATAIVGVDSRVWHISYDGFEVLMDKFPQIAVGLLPILAKRNRWLISQYENLSFLPVRARTAKLLLDISDDGKKLVDRQGYPVHEMAGRISTAPEVLSRAMRSLKDDGYIDYDREEIEIVNASGLKKIAYIEMG